MKPAFPELRYNTQIPFKKWLAKHSSLFANGILGKAVA
jgi:hypothetical protein